MNLEFIEKLWDDDSKIDNDELHLESTKVPSLHSKYYKIYNNILVLKKDKKISTKYSEETSGSITLANPRQKSMQRNRLISKYSKLI